MDNKKHSEATKIKIRNSNLGQRRSKEFCERLSKIQTARMESKELRDRISKSLTGKKLTKQHIEKIKKANSGEKNWKWIKDRSKLKRHNRRNDMAYKDWRRQVWLRDNFKCKIGNPDCKGRIEAHHILPWRDHENIRYEVNNGITLCHFHHPRKREEEIRLSPYFQEIITKLI